MNEFSVFWLLMGVLSVCLFWTSAGIMILSLQQRRIVFLLPGIILLPLQYFFVQCICMYVWPENWSPSALGAAKWFTSFPRQYHLLLFGLLFLTDILVFRDLRKYERTRITGMSLKEAFDSLPSGLCFYLDGGRILLRNRAIEKISRSCTGEALISGERLHGQVFGGKLSPGCRVQMLGGTAMVGMPDQTVWNVSEQSGEYEGRNLHILQATEVTELYQKTRMLQSTQKRLSALNERLAAYNREIVAMTAEKELLSARVRLHDEMGEDLLTIRSYIQNGGSERERRAIETRLKRNLAFLLTGHSSTVRDEYDLLLETAQRLDVSVFVRGTLPQTEPQKHVAAAAIHECLTNTLRHARGNELTVSAEESDHMYILSFTNNGKQPEGPIQEKGGLASLRKLAENAGGSMRIAVEPSFLVQLALPREVPDDL